MGKKLNLLIIGASGLVGGALYTKAKEKGHTVLGTYNQYPIEGLHRLDYSDQKEVENTIKEFKPDFIVSPAAIANVDWLEKNPQEAWRINVLNLNNLFETAAKNNIGIAFYSSDYIFDGIDGPYNEDAKPNPLNIYGKHKEAAEIMLTSLLPKNHFIFRTTWVFGYEKRGKNFLYTVVNNLSNKREMKIPDDMISTPSYAIDVARFSIELIEKGNPGIYNLTNGELISRYEFAKSIANSFNLDSSLIIPVKNNTLDQVAKRPLKAGLKNEKSIKATNMRWTPVKDAIKETKKEMEKQGQFPLITKDNSSKICIYVPCYNATSTLPKVFERIPKQVKEKVQEVFVVDNASKDFTYLMAIGYREKNSDIKNLKILKNVKNFGYGGSQKLAYAYAIKHGYDLVIMLHGDAQYAPEKLPVMIEKMEKDKSIDLLFGSRMTGDPLAGGMPLHRYLGNKALTWIQNKCLGTNISEFHSGYRIFRTSALKEVPFHLCDSYYHFDTEIILQFINKGLKIAEVPIETYYGTEKCYVNIWKYGINVLVSTFFYWLHKKGIKKYETYNKSLKAEINKIFDEFKTEIH